MVTGIISLRIRSLGSLYNYPIGITFVIWISALMLIASPNNGMSNLPRAIAPFSRTWFFLKIPVRYGMLRPEACRASVLTKKVLDAWGILGHSRGKGGR
jgi:hypothetical protein